MFYLEYFIAHTVGYMTYMIHLMPHNAMSNRTVGVLCDKPFMYTPISLVRLNLYT